VTYKAKVDRGIGLAILAGIVLPAISAIQLHRPWLLALPAALMVFMLIAVWPQKYEIHGDALRIRAGLTTRTIPWSSITNVSPATDSRSSLALSLDRILVQHSGGEILIAPVDQARFFDDVASHCPQLSRRGMDLAIAFH
jgi:hypothetical protein